MPLILSILPLEYRNMPRKNPNKSLSNPIRVYLICECCECLHYAAMQSGSMESITITAALHINRGVNYVTIPKKAAEQLGIKPGDAVAVKIARADIPDGF